MKKLLFILLFFIPVIVSAQLVIPRVPSLASVTSPLPGMQVYSIVDQKMYFRTLTAWIDMTGGGTYTANNGIKLNGSVFQLGNTALLNQATTIRTSYQNKFSIVSVDGNDSTYLVTDTDASGIGIRSNKGQLIYVTPQQMFFQNDSLGMILTGTDLTINDNRFVKKGIEYSGNYSTGFGARSLIDKGYGDNNYAPQTLAAPGVTGLYSGSTTQSLTGKTFVDVNKYSSQQTMDNVRNIPDIGNVRQEINDSLLAHPIPSTKQLLNFRANTNMHTAFSVSMMDVDTLFIVSREGTQHSGEAARPVIHITTDLGNTFVKTYPDTTGMGGGLDVGGLGGGIIDGVQFVFINMADSVTGLGNSYLMKTGNGWLSNTVQTITIAGYTWAVPYGPITAVGTRLIQNFYGLMGATTQSFTIESTDGGDTWGTIRTIAIGNTTDSIFNETYIKAVDADTLVAFTRHADGQPLLSKSTDGALTWTMVGFISNAGLQWHSPLLYKVDAGMYAVFADRVSLNMVRIGVAGNYTSLAAWSGSRKSVIAGTLGQYGAASGDFGYPQVITYNGAQNMIWYDVSSTESDPTQVENLNTDLIVTPLSDIIKFQGNTTVTSFIEGTVPIKMQIITLDNVGALLSDSSSIVIQKDATYSVTGNITLNYSSGAGTGANKQIRFVRKTPPGGYSAMLFSTEREDGAGSGGSGPASTALSLSGDIFLRKGDTVYFALYNQGAGPFTVDANYRNTFSINEIGASIGLGAGALSLQNQGVPLTDGDKGDITISGSGTIFTVDDQAVTNAKRANMASKTYSGRTSAGTGVPEDVPVATMRTDLSVNLTNNTADADKPVSTAQQTALNLKVNISDSAAMLTNYRHWLQGYLKAADITGKLNIPDTAAMLTNYRHWLQGYLKAADIAGKLNISDTASMLTNYRHWLQGYFKLTQMSVTSDASGLKLSGDATSPGNDVFYGTNGSGVKGWYTPPGSGGGEANTGSNLGGGLANYSTKVGVDLRFNSFSATHFSLASNVISVATNAITNALAAQMAANTIKGNNTGSTANAVDMTVAQTKTLLALTATDVGLGNVTNESKATMFTSPVFTGATGTIPNTWIGVSMWSQVLGSNATTTGQSLVDITGLSNALVANATYEFESQLSAQTTSVTTGTGYGVQFSAAGAAVEAGIYGALTTTAVKNLRISALNTSAQAWLTTSAQTGTILIKGRITTGANAGNLTIRHLKVTSGTSTVFIGSYLRTTRIL